MSQQSTILPYQLPPAHYPRESISHAIRILQNSLSPPAPTNAVHINSSSLSGHPIHSLLPTHPMVTHGKAGIFKPKLYSAHIPPISPSVEPLTVESAMLCPQWKQAMELEFKALQANRTWILVPPQPNQRLVGNKWIFKLKRKPDGIILHHKARLVAKGFTQKSGLDFSETVSLVIKPSTLWVILSIVVFRNWSICQLDIYNAF